MRVLSHTLSSYCSFRSHARIPEAVGGFPNSGTIGSKGDRLETNVELFAFDDRARRAPPKGAP